MLIIIAILVVAVAFGMAGLMGAPYVPILHRDSVNLLKLANLRSGQTLVDLGSGDGRLLLAAARQGVVCIGYEINPFMVLVSRMVCWRYRRLVTIHLADIWHTKLPPADVIYVFLMPQFMERLHQKLRIQISHPTRVISYAFQIPGVKAVEQNSNTFVYLYGDSK